MNLRSAARVAEGEFILVLDGLATGSLRPPAAPVCPW